MQRYSILLGIRVSSELRTAHLLLMLLTGAGEYPLGHICTIIFRHLVTTFPFPLALHVLRCMTFVELYTTMTCQKHLQIRAQTEHPSVEQQFQHTCRVRTSYEPKACVVYP